MLHFTFSLAKSPAEWIILWSRERGIPDPAFPPLFLDENLASRTGLCHRYLEYRFLSPFSCQNFGQSCFLGSSQIPYPIIARIPHCILVKSRGTPGSRSRPWSMDILSVQETTCLLHDFVWIEFNIMNEESLPWSQRRRSTAGAHHLMGSCLKSFSYSWEI